MDEQTNLNLHLGEENFAVLGHLELACTVDEHFESTPGTCDTARDGVRDQLSRRGDTSLWASRLRGARREAGSAPRFDLTT